MGYDRDGQRHWFFKVCVNVVVMFFNLLYFRIYLGSFVSMLSRSTMNFPQMRGCGALCAGDDDHSVCVRGCGVLCAGDDDHSVCEGVWCLVCR